MLNRLSGRWVIVDREILALWTRLLFGFACFGSLIEWPRETLHSATVSAAAAEIFASTFT